MNFALKPLFIFALFVVGNFIYCCDAFCEGGKSEQHFVPAEISAELRAAFFDAISENKPLSIAREGADKAQSDPQLKNIWLGNRPELAAAFDKIELNFEAPPATPEGEKESFQVLISFKDDFEGKKLVVRPSRPAVYGTEGGILFRLVGNSSRRSVIRGLKRSTIATTTPETPGDGLRGVLICPFDTSLRPGSSGNESGFRPVSVRLDPHATAEGRLLSGINLGLARARVLTSPEIPNEKVPFDESYSKDPYVDVFYQREEMTQPILFDSAGKIRQGLKAEIVLQTSGGHLRESALTATLEISPVEKDFEFAVSSMKTEYKIHSRTCWAVIQSTRLDQEYSKSELQPPH